MFRWTATRWIFAAMAVIGPIALMAGCGGGGSNTSQYPLSVSRVVELQTALQQYLNDYDEVAPLANNWMDSTTPYVHDPNAYHSPAVGAGGYGYALNSNVAGAAYTSFAIPDNVISIFDSTDVARNACVATTTMPNPTRYAQGNTTGYLSGRTKDQNITPVQMTEYQTSQSRLKQDSLGVLIYSNDYDDVLPLANKWMDGLGPYVKNPANFQSPAVVDVNSSLYGYAMNTAVAGQSSGSFTSPATEIGLFDSTDLQRNATEPTSTLPNPPRYGSNNTIGFLDGHVR